MKKPIFPRHASKNRIFAFKTNEYVAKLLERESNKSEAVNEALMLYYRKYKVCPRCDGTGKVKWKKG